MCVAAVQVRQQFVEQIAPAGAIPQVVVRVDDRQIGFEDLLAPAVQPLLANGRGAAGVLISGLLRFQIKDSGSLIRLRLFMPVSVADRCSSLCYRGQVIVWGRAGAARHDVDTTGGR